MKVGLGKREKRARWKISRERPRALKEPRNYSQAGGK